jgi:hypothetical protein
MNMSIRKIPSMLLHERFTERARAVHTQTFVNCPETCPRKLPEVCSLPGLCANPTSFKGGMSYIVPSLNLYRVTDLAGDIACCGELKQLTVRYRYFNQLAPSLSSNRSSGSKWWPVRGLSSHTPVLTSRNIL